MARKIPINDPDLVRRTLLALLANDAVAPDYAALRLEASKWATMQAIARQHRLQPLLHHLARLRSGVPADVQRAWREAFRNSSLQSLAAQATLIKLGVLLDLANIPYAALKGARLAWHAYAHPGLRPMRDIDILVASDKAAEVYHALIGHGFDPAPGDKMPVEVALRDHKHLPGLVDRATGIRVEVHLRLFEIVSAHHTQALLCNADLLLANRDMRQIGKQPIAFLPPTETLLHLLIHSAYEHRFDNGPQIIHDAAALLARDLINWPRFWKLAHEGSWQRGCQLVLRLTEHYLGPQTVTWDESGQSRVPHDVLDQTALLMLQDTDRRQDLAVQIELAAGADSRWSDAARLLSRFRAPRHVVAEHAGVRPELPWIWTHYPAWLFSRLRRTISGALSSDQNAEVARAMAVEGWLEA